MTAKIDLNDLNWTETPANQDLCFGEWASLPQEDTAEAQFIVDYDIDGTRKARLVVDDSLSTVKTAVPGRWASSTDPADWPVLDDLFGHRAVESMACWQDRGNARPRLRRPRRLTTMQTPGASAPGLRNQQ